MAELSARYTQNADPPAQDPLTVAYGRALLGQQIERQIADARQHDASFSLCLFDLDYFKNVNDTYGHARGDQVLRDLIWRVQSMIRRTDMLFRYSAARFALLLPDTSDAQALALARRLLDGVRGECFAGQPPLWLSLSMGVANYPADASDIDQLVDLADRRSSAAKSLGGAQVVGAGSASPSTLPVLDHAPLIEREQALEALQRFLARLPGEQRGALGVRGAPGSGRTRFLAEAAGVAHLRDYATLILHARATMRGRPYGALSSATWPGEPPGSMIADEVSAVLHRALAGQAGLLIVVDNLPALDRPTLDLLRILIADATIECLGLVYSTGVSDPPMLFYRAPPLRELIELQPLTLAGLRFWLRGLLCMDPPTAFLDWLHRETGGMPGAVQRGIAFLFEQHMLRQIPGQDWSIDSSYAAIPLARRLGLRAAPAPNNLPVPRTEFVGREQDLERLIALLDTQRLVTLLGPGGIGKTRLALQLAALLLEEPGLSGGASFADGICFVPLAATSDPALVADAIARTLGVGEHVGTPGQRLYDYLHDKQLLLVLDSFEHVRAAAPLVAELLAAPQLKVLVTSRSALHLSGEQRFVVPPLALPDLKQFAPDGAGAAPPALIADDQVFDLFGYAGVALFVQCAQAVKPDFALTSGNARAVAEICARLDGLPLAIELAAGRSNLLTPAALLAWLRGSNGISPLRLLTGGPRDLPARQQTLRGTIDWSYQLLDQGARRLFARLAVFVGGCTLEAAEAVCGSWALGVGSWGDGAASPTPISQLPTPILDGLAALVDQSLLRQDADANGEPRFVMINTIREYAIERLDEQGEAEALRRRHATCYLALAEQAEPHLQGAEQRLWLERLDVERDNLRAALQWTLDHGESELAGRFCVALWRFWAVHSQPSEGRQWLEAILAQQPPAPAPTRATMLSRAAMLLLFDGQLARATALCRECIDLARPLGDRRACAYALLTLGGVAMKEGDYERARPLLAESLDLFRAAGPLAGLTWTLDWMGDLARIQGDYARAAACYQESLTLRRPIGEQEGIGWSCHHLGDLAGIQGDYPLALAFYQESRDMFQAMGHREAIARVLARIGQVELLRNNLTQAQAACEESLALAQGIDLDTPKVQTLHCLANVACEQGDLARARDLHLQGLALTTTIEARDYCVYSLRGIARLMAAQGQPLRAARLFGAAEAQQSAVSKWGAPLEPRYYIPIIGFVRAQLGAAAWATAWASGQALTIEQALAEARSASE